MEKFCRFCGKAAIDFFFPCPHCGKEISVMCKFCEQCGRPVQEEVRAWIESEKKRVRGEVKEDGEDGGNDAR